MAERDWRGGLIWFIWFVLFIWLVSFNQRNQTDQTNKRNKLFLALYAPRSQADFFSILLSLNLLSEAISQSKQQRTGYVDVFLVQRPFEERLDEGDVCGKRFAEHRVALLRQSDFDAAAVAPHGVPSNEPFRHEPIEDAR